MSQTPRTQKAKGVFALARHGLSRMPFLISKDADFDDLDNGIWHPKTFARPCPMRPRHGFVESRIVATKEECRAVWEETKAADPRGELLLMPYINAAQSAVVTPAAVVIGKGHDGATSGAAGCITLPLAHLNLEQFDLESLGVLDTPYFESVRNSEYGKQISIVQIRDGARPPETLGNFIPRDVTVTNVLTAGGDLLEWERLIK